MNGLETVVKVGGSLSEGQGLPYLCREIGRLGAQHRILVVPGGAGFADLVRDCYRRFELSETTAHRMAILAMEQYGCLLGELIPGGCLVADPAQIKQASEAGEVPVWLPDRLLAKVDPLPHSWQVTSDSIAAWFAGYLDVKKLILLKSVDGLFSSAPSEEGSRLRSRMRIDELPLQPGGVDEHLAILLKAQKLETWVINGRYPDRLRELLELGGTLGTRITGYD